MISIITCNFNLGHLLNKTIESVLLQNKKEIECIIIDANSKDNSLEIIKKLQRKDDRVKYISEYDEGHFYGINTLKIILIIFFKKSIILNILNNFFKFL